MANPPHRASMFIRSLFLVFLAFRCLLEDGRVNYLWALSLGFVFGAFGFWIRVTDQFSVVVVVVVVVVVEVFWLASFFGHLV
jgi:hypothetical protein